MSSYYKTLEGERTVQREAQSCQPLNQWWPLPSHAEKFRSNG